jgi:hypothetical protein
MWHAVISQFTMWQPQVQRFLHSPTLQLLFCGKRNHQPYPTQLFLVTVRLRFQQPYITFSKILLMTYSIALNPSRMRLGGGSFYKIIIIYYPMISTGFHQALGALGIYVLLDLSMVSKYCTLQPLQNLESPLLDNHGTTDARQSWNHWC